ncbi:META domain-containing protein [Sphingomicrobium flavum]|uniref:META domain-containing protein n=1 Tax=Sphingomicrobium flavum TaxID=1229164 RepID=UPI0021AE1B0E|nr:META domain-containing protein [Sphingomicrobium flavum]
MKKLALLLPLALTACMTSPYGRDDPYRESAGNRDPYPAPYPDRSGSQQPGMNEPYRASGTEPFWSLNIDSREMRFETMDGIRYSEPTPPVRPDRYGDVFEGRGIVAMIERRECSDGMSDRIYPDTVRVRFNGQEWRGCGAPAIRYSQGWEQGYPPRQDYPDRPEMDRQPYPNPDYNSGGALERTNWTVTSVNGQFVERRDYYINFTPGEMSARFGCNTLSGDYSVSGSTLNAGPIRSTRMACPDMSAETSASNILSSPVQFTLNGDTLVLRNRQGNIVARRAR